MQFAIGEARMRIDAARLLTWRAAWLLDAGRDARTEVAAAKLIATETAYGIVDEVIQLFGAMGTSRELPLEGWWRDLRVARIVEGASEILRHQVATAELGASQPATSVLCARQTPSITNGASITSREEG